MMTHNDASIMIVGGNFRGKGAEAMMLTVQQSLRAAAEDITCQVSCHTQEEARLFSSHGLCPIRTRRPSRLLGRTHFLLTAARLMPNGPIDPVAIRDRGILNPFRASRALVDISGFASSDQFGPRSAIGRWRNCLLARRAGNRLIFMPQSWGPFENPWVRWSTRATLRMADVVFAREKLSLEYLKSLRLGSTEVRLAPDVAFQFPASPPSEGERLLADAGCQAGESPIIGITPNMRIAERTEGNGTENVYVRGLKRLIDILLDETSGRIVLIPHELPERGPNDPELCRSLLDAVQRPDSVFMVDGRESAAAIKSAIGRLDFLIASRYHSLIAALSMRVPVAVVGWSHKYDDVMQEVGIERWVVDPVRRSDEGVTERMLEAWHHRAAIREAEEARVPHLEARSQEALDQLTQVVCGASYDTSTSGEVPDPVSV